MLFSTAGSVNDGGAYYRLFHAAPDSASTPKYIAPDELETSHMKKELVETENRYCVLQPAEYEVLSRDVLMPFICSIEGRAEQLGHGGSNEVPGRSGFPHQIDISFRAAGVRALVECKCWNNAIPVGQVLQFAARVIDISEKLGSVRGIMVTTKGYQSGAQIVADYFKISLSIVRNVSEFILNYGGSVGAGVADKISFSDSLQYDLGISNASGKQH